jgi:hypothetical protein
LKKKILNFRITATHQSIVDLPTLNDPRSISDFDAFIFDPNGIPSGGLALDHFLRRRQELRDLLTFKGGIVVCLLRHALPSGVSIPGRNVTTYDILDLSMGSALAQVLSTLRAGQGSHIALNPDSKGVSTGYLRILSRALHFAAYLDTDAASLTNYRGTVLAVDSVSHPIAFEFVVGAGRVCFVPIPDGAPGDRVGSAIVRIIEAHYGGPSEIEPPSWLGQTLVPGADAHNGAIAQLEGKKAQIEGEIEQLSQKRTDLLNFRLLLYGYGDSILEPVVRAAFRLLGFVVPEPEQYTGEWDIELREPSASQIAIGEVEGSQGPVDVDKYRQLLDYIQAEVLEGRDHKGILIGNGFRLTAPDAQERQNQFSNHAILGAKKNQFCLLPTTELFKAVCAVLESPEGEGQKIQIRNSILATVGIWKFAREARAISAAITPDPSALPRDNS